MNELSQPFESLKVVIQEATKSDDDYHNNEVSVFPMQLGHKIKVHTVNTSDSGWDGKDTRPGGKFTNDFVLSHIDHGHIGIHDHT